MNMVTKEGELLIDTDDEIVHDTMMTRNGKVVHPRILEMMGEKLAEPKAEDNSSNDSDESDDKEEQLIRELKRR